MFDPFTFKCLQLEPGDLVVIDAESFPFTFEAAVIDYDADTDTLEVMSTQLVITRHSGRFPATDVHHIEIIHHYEAGVRIGARTNLVRGQHCVVQPQGVVATVTAAHDGVVTGRVVDTPGVEDGTQITGGSSYWHAA